MQGSTNRIEFRDHDGGLLAYKIGSSWPSGLQALSADGDFLQLLTWNYAAGTELKAHVHLPARREVAHTQEAVVVFSGCVEAQLYDNGGHAVGNVDVQAGEVLVLLTGGHGYRIAAEDTRVLELKNGPYVGAENDRQRL